MNKNEIMETLQSNGKDNKKKIVLIFIASLLAMAAAVLGLLRYKKSKKSDGRKADKVGSKKSAKAKKRVEAKAAKSKKASTSGRKKTFARTGEKATVKPEHKSVPVVQGSVAKAVQPTYVVHPLPAKKHESRAKRFRRRMCASVAAILVLSLLASDTLQYVQPTQVYAKESFAGISKVVDEHTDVPYRILDIVPTEVEDGNGNTFALGTMGYLADGQSPLSQTLKSMAGNSNYRTYSAREGLLSNVGITEGAAFPNVKYEERYGSVDGDDDSLQASGWTLMFPATVADVNNLTDSGVPVGATTGVFKGDAKPYKTGADKTGYDFVLIGSSGKWSAIGLGLENAYKLYPLEGESHVSFVGDPEGDYVVDRDDYSLKDIASYAPSTWVYIKTEDGTYKPAGMTIWDLVKDRISNSGNGATDDITECQHTLEKLMSDDGGHWWECECGEYKSDTEDHAWEDYGDVYVCSVCFETKVKSDETIQDTNTAPDQNTSTTPDQNTSTTPETEPDDGEEEGGTGSGTTGGSDDNDDNTGGNTGDDEIITGEDGGDGDDDDDEITALPTTPDSVEEVEQINSSDVVVGSAKNNSVSGRWIKLANEGLDGETSEDETSVTETTETETGSSSNESNDNWWESINWDDVDLQGYYVVTFRVAKSEDEGKTLYSVGDVTGADGETFDAYKWEGTEDEPEDEYGISLTSLEIDPVLETASGAIDGTFAYVGPGNGNWQLTRNAKGEGTIQVTNVSVYYRYSTSNDWLKQYVFRASSGMENENESFEIEVITMRADKVTPDIVNGVDLIYLESGNNSASLVNSNSSWTTKFFNDEGGDISNSSLGAILQRATEDMIPVIVDYDIIANHQVVAADHDYGGTAYWYLARAFMKEDLADFYAAIDVGGNLVANLMTNIEADGYPDREGSNYVNRNVYMVNDDLVCAEFAEPFDVNTALSGFSDVLAAIKAENTMLADENKIPETVSRARAIQYIINYSVGIIGEFDDLLILELQPTANRTSNLSTVQDSKGYTKLCWKTDAMTKAKQILYSKKSFNITTDIKSVVEYNGAWEDINGVYDMVFIGLDGQRLNLSNDVERSTQYNNTSLNGLVYHRGDESGAGKYDDNDITAQKMSDLLEFLEAGYPVVVDSRFFTKGSAQKATSEDDISTKYVSKDTVMFRFLASAISDERYKDFIFTVNDTTSSPVFMTQVRISRPRINLVSDGDGEAARVQMLMPDETTGEYHGTISYNITDNRGEDYLGDTVIHLYADYNYDGIFQPEEEVTEYSNDSNTLDVVISGMGPGILPWKLEVSDVGKEYRRDSVQGYFELHSSASGEMKVLQITENTDDSRINLQTIYHSKEDALLAYYLRSAENVINSTLQFETVSAAQLEERLNENGKYLEQWDVVVLTMDGAVANGVVNEAVTQYAEAGRSLLVCSQDANPERMGLSADLLGQMDDSRTYANLGMNSGGTLLRYAGLSRDMFEGKTLLQAEAINDGSITCYPYVIDNITFGERGLLKAPTYLLNFNDNLKSEGSSTYVTAWYTFGGSEDTAYGISPRDARNNYYCYSKGNVVYLAQSEYPYTYDNQNTATADGEGAGESKLFVNALMAAYSAGVHNANVHIVAGFAPDSAQIESIAIPFDDIWYEADNTTGILDNNVDVYFRFRDSNVAKDKTMFIQFLYEDPTGPELDIGGRTVNARPFGSKIWTVEDNRLNLIGEVGEEGLSLTGDNLLKPGQTYRIEAPVITLQGNENMNKADIYIVIQTSFTRSGRDYNVISSDVVSLNRAQLFLLE